MHSRFGDLDATYIDEILGDISGTHFFNNTQVSFLERPDLDLLRPCCDSVNYVTANGFILDLLTMSADADDDKSIAQTTAETSGKKNKNSVKWSMEVIVGVIIGCIVFVVTVLFAVRYLLKLQRNGNVTAVGVAGTSTVEMASTNTYMENRRNYVMNDL